MLSERARKEVDVALSNWALYITKTVPELGYPSKTPYYLGQRPKAVVLDEMIKKALRKGNAKWAKASQTRNKPKPHFIKYMGTKNENLLISNAVSDMPLEWRQIVITKYLPPEKTSFKTDNDVAVFLGLNQQKCSKYLMAAYIYVCGKIDIPL